MFDHLSTYWMKGLIIYLLFQEILYHRSSYDSPFLLIFLLQNHRLCIKRSTESIVYMIIKLTLLHGCFSYFLNCTNGTKSLNASNIIENTINPFQTIFPFLYPLETPKRSAKTKIYVNFYFNATFWNARGVKG